MAKKKIAALLIAAAVAAGGWALPARVSAAENDGTAVTWQQDETESSEQNSDEEAAVQEQMKSERLKADLITNVSHDIKTPLTSIINYVDLLKRENIENEKAKDYIRVLDEKSQRLKQLTEDLVEASKISSGNIKLEFMNLNLNELVQQFKLKK